jgi:hypothetical protein
VPIGACSNGTSFSWCACGAWSVATQSMSPLRSASTSARRSRSLRRVHLEAAVERAHHVVGQRQVVGRGLAADTRAGGLRCRERLNRLGAREVLEVRPCVLVARECGVPRDHRRLRHGRDPREPEPRGHRALVHHAVSRERRILFVQRDDASGQALVLKRLAQDAGGYERLAVVGEAERTGVAQVRHLGQLLTAQPARDRGQEAGRDVGLPACRLGQRAEDRGVVDDGVGVRHRDHGAEASGRRGGSAGVDVLLVFLAGRAQVHVRVDEAGERVLARGVDDLAAARLGQSAGCPELGDVAIADQDVALLVELGSRVEHVR